MVSNKWMTLIYHSFVRNNTKVSLHGDSYQCDPVEGMSRIVYDNTKSPAILDMCHKTIEKKYIKESARYDIKTHNMLTEFLKTGQLNENFNKYTATFVNICYHNNTRIAINKMCADEFAKDKNHHTVKFISDKKIETYKASDGMPVICTANMRDRKMYNSQQFTIRKI